MSFYDVSQYEITCNTFFDLKEATINFMYQKNNEIISNQHSFRYLQKKFFKKLLNKNGNGFNKNC